jgi:hypothetical protein
VPFLYSILSICIVCVHTAGSAWRGVIPRSDSIYRHCLHPHCRVHLARCHSPELLVLAAAIDTRLKGAGATPSGWLRCPLCSKALKLRASLTCHLRQAHLAELPGAAAFGAAEAQAPPGALPCLSVCSPPVASATGGGTEKGGEWPASGAGAAAGIGLVEDRQTAGGSASSTVAPEGSGSLPPEVAGRRDLAAVPSEPGYETPAAVLLSGESPAPKAASRPGRGRGPDTAKNLVPKAAGPAPQMDPPAAGKGRRGRPPKACVGAAASPSQSAERAQGRTGAAQRGVAAPGVGRGPKKVEPSSEGVGGRRRSGPIAAAAARVGALLGLQLRRLRCSVLPAGPSVCPSVCLSVCVVCMPAPPRTL